MTQDLLTTLFEHNDWANARVLEACAALDDEQLDASSHPGTPWSLRHTLTHLVEAQRGYLALLSLPPEERRAAPLAFDELQESARASGAGLLALARAAHDAGLRERIRTTDGHVVERRVVLLQALNHATEHRRQACGMLRGLGATPPRIDGWGYGEALGAVVAPSG